MSTAFGRFVRLLLGTRPAAHMLDGFVDSLVQSFENCRAGLSDEMLRTGGATVENFFAVQYEKERPRLRELIRMGHGHLSPNAQAELLDKIESYVVSVLVPAYARLARQVTSRERNDFYLTPAAWHAAERLGWAGAGMLAGLFAIKSAYIPIWADEWVIVFAAGGLVLPELRRVLGLRRYESELNTLVRHADDEIFRLDLALMSLEPLPELDPAPGAPETSTRGATLRAEENQTFPRGKRGSSLPPESKGGR